MAETVVLGIKFKVFLLKTYILLFHSLTEDGKCLNLVVNGLINSFFISFNFNKFNIVCIYREIKLLYLNKYKDYKIFM